MRRRELIVSAELLLARLKIEGCQLTGVSINPREGTVSLFVIDPTKPPIVEGANPYPEHIRTVHDH